MTTQLDELSSAVFDDVEEMMSATKAELVDGMLMNSYAAAYYMMKFNDTSFVVGHRTAAESDMTVGIVRTKHEDQITRKITGCAVYHFWEKTWLRPEQEKATSKYEVCTFPVMTSSFCHIRGLYVHSYASCK